MYQKIMSHSHGYFTTLVFFMILGDRLHNAMEAQFLTAIQQNDAEVLKRCLRIYASVERISDAERLLRSEIISPYLEVAEKFIPRSQLIF